MLFGHPFVKACVLGAIAALIGQAAWAQTGPFTQGQVTAGHKNYVGYCSACHGEDLAGAADAPPLAGAFFRQNWGKYDVSRLYAFVANAMPQGLEGELKPEEYASIIAYMLAANGAKPGSTAFSGKSEVKIGDITTGKMVPSVMNAPIP